MNCETRGRRADVGARMSERGNRKRRARSDAPYLRGLPTDAAIRLLASDICPLSSDLWPPLSDLPTYSKRFHGGAGGRQKEECRMQKSEVGGRANQGSSSPFSAKNFFSRLDCSLKSVADETSALPGKRRARSDAPYRAIRHSSFVICARSRKSRLNGAGCQTNQPGHLATRRNGIFPVVGGF